MSYPMGGTNKMFASFDKYFFAFTTRVSGFRFFDDVAGHAGNSTRDT